jgi:hypothetical protein
MVMGFLRCDLPRQGLKYVSLVLGLEEKFRRDEEKEGADDLAARGRDRTADNDVLAREVDMLGG